MRDRKKRIFGITLLLVVLTRLWIHTFRHGLRLCNIVTTNHPKPFREGRRFSGRPNIIRRTLSHGTSRIRLGGATVLVDGGMPIHTFIFFDISRIGIRGCVHQSFPHGQPTTRSIFLLRSTTTRVHARLRSIKGMHMIGGTRRG